MIDGGGVVAKQEDDPRAGWVIGEEFDKVRAESGWESEHDQRWPFRYTPSGSEDWEGRAYVL